MCLRLNTVSRRVSDEPDATPGVKFVGVSTKFLCYPKTIQNLEFTRLPCRSKEGLEIKLDINVEYQLNPGKLKALFDEVQFGYEGVYTDVAYSALRNVASRFYAVDYLSAARANISAPMLLSLQERLKPRHADVLNVNLRSIGLESSFETAFKAVEEARLQGTRLIQQRPVAINTQNRQNVSDVLALLQARERALIQARQRVTVAELTQTSLLTAFDNTEVQARARAVTSRQTSWITARTRVSEAEAQRQATVQVKQNEKAQRLIAMKTVQQQATGAARVTRVNANSTAQVRFTEATAQANTLRAFGDAQHAEFSALASDAGMTPSNVVQFRWVQVLRNASTTPFFVDYRKVSMFQEPNPGQVSVNVG